MRRSCSYFDFDLRNQQQRQQKLWILKIQMVSRDEVHSK